MGLTGGLVDPGIPAFLRCLPSHTPGRSHKKKAIYLLEGVR